MAGKGNPKGTNHGGGWRTGQQSKKVARRRADARIAKASEQAAKIVREEAARSPQVKFAKEVMSEAMNYYFGLAATYQPGVPQADEKKFMGYLDKAVDVAAKLAPYQHQRLAAVQVTQQPLDLKKLSIPELQELERLIAQAAVAGGNPGGAGNSLH